MFDGSEEITVLIIGIKKDSMMKGAEEMGHGMEQKHVTQGNGENGDFIFWLMNVTRQAILFSKTLICWCVCNDISVREDSPTERREPQTLPGRS